jgi:hypothetical protein
MKTMLLEGGVSSGAIAIGMDDIKLMSIPSFLEGSNA